MANQTEEHAVYVRNAYKHFGSKKKGFVIFDDLNMTVRKGTIYGLLGASGVGKTTMLQCIVGRSHLDYGKIWVIGGQPNCRGSGVPGKRVGYMPQELALFGEFTIKETMRYFGSIYGMSKKKQNERINFLADFLGLPTRWLPIGFLSGGQKRRVSLAVSLLHEPELLILDEPTVGVDPLLRRKIWAHLIDLSKSKLMTIIITTHYIEEARQANYIGLMRGGKLLAEDTPTVLIKTFKKSTLEEVFLLLSQQQSGTTTVIEYTASQLDDIPETTWEPGCIVVALCFALFHWTTIGKSRALLKKQLLILSRNLGLVMLMFVVPIIQVVLFCLTIGHKPQNLPFSIVNDEINSTYPDCPLPETCPLMVPDTILSCIFINKLGEEELLSMRSYELTSDAIKAVEKGKSWGVLHFGPLFSKAYIKRFNAGMATSEIFDESTIDVRLDLSNMQIGLFIIEVLDYAMAYFAHEVLNLCKDTFVIHDQATQLSLQFGAPLFGKSSPTFLDFTAPGLVLGIVFFLAISLTSLSIIVERNNGLMDRSFVAGVYPFELLASHCFVTMIIVTVQCIIILSVVNYGFKIQCVGKFELAFALTLIQAFCGIALGYTISVMCNQVETAILITVGLFYPITLLSGILWPIDAIRGFFYYFASVMPLSYSVQALRAIYLRGWNTEKYIVRRGFFSASIWALFFVTVAIIFIKIKK